MVAPESQKPLVIISFKHLILNKLFLKIDTRICLLQLSGRISGGPQRCQVAGRQTAVRGGKVPQSQRDPDHELRGVVLHARSHGTHPSGHRCLCQV